MTEPAELLVAALYANLHGRRFGEVGKPVPSDTTIYRVEMADGTGPFNKGEKANPEVWQKLVENRERGWPGHLLTYPQFRTEQNGVSEIMFRHVHGAAAYATASLAALNTWFPPTARSYLASVPGAKIVQYTIPAGQPLLSWPDLAGEVVFNPLTARRERELPIDMEITDAPLI